MESNLLERFGEWVHNQGFFVERLEAVTVYNFGESSEDTDGAMAFVTNKAGEKLMLELIEPTKDDEFELSNADCKYMVFVTNGWPESDEDWEGSPDYELPEDF